MKKRLLLEGLFWEILFVGKALGFLLNPYPENNKLPLTERKGEKFNLSSSSVEQRERIVLPYFHEKPSVDPDIPKILLAFQEEPERIERPIEEVREELEKIAKAIILYQGLGAGDISWETLGRFGKQLIDLISTEGITGNVGYYERVHADGSITSVYILKDEPTELLRVVVEYDEHRDIKKVLRVAQTESAGFPSLYLLEFCLGKRQLLIPLSEEIRIRVHEYKFPPPNEDFQKSLNYYLYGQNNPEIECAFYETDFFFLTSDFQVSSKVEEIKEELRIAKSELLIRQQIDNSQIAESEGLRKQINEQIKFEDLVSRYRSEDIDERGYTRTDIYNYKDGSALFVLWENDLKGELYPAKFGKMNNAGEFEWVLKLLKDGMLSKAGGWKGKLSVIVTINDFYKDEIIEENYLINQNYPSAKVVKFGIDE